MIGRHASMRRELVVGSGLILLGGGTLPDCGGPTGLRDTVFPELFGASDR